MYYDVMDDHISYIAHKVAQRIITKTKFIFNHVGVVNMIACTVYSHHRGGDIGGKGACAPTFLPGGQSTPKLFDHSTEQSTKIALLLARNAL